MHGVWTNPKYTIFYFLNFLFLLAHIEKMVTPIPYLLFAKYRHLNHTFRTIDL